MRIMAVVVIYQPETVALFQLLDNLLAMAVPTVLVDNGSEQAVRAALEKRAQSMRMDSGGLLYCPQRANIGIASAQNQGTEKAFALGAEAVWLLDQDSTPHADCLAALVDVLQSAGTDQFIAAVAPCFEDHEAARESDYLCFKSRGEVARATAPAHGKPLVLAAAIASGMLIPRPAWEEIGPMQDALFIDCVDTEWCFRASSLGWQVLLIPDARMGHRIGGALQPLWPGSSRQVRLRPALRNFFLFRNSLWLARMPHCPPGWLRLCLKQMLGLCLVALWHGPSRLQQLSAIFRGICSGWLDRLPGKRTIP